MLLKLFMILIMTLEKVYEFITLHIAIKHRDQPLPEVVADIYDEERYRIFRNYKKDYLIPSLLESCLSLSVNIIIILSPFFSYMEKLGNHNIYLIFLVTLTTTSLIDLIVGLPFDYYSTFVIEEKYDKNKKTKKEFFKDIILDFVSTLILMSVIVLPVTALVIYLHNHTTLTHFTYTSSLLFTLILALGIFVVYMIAMGISYAVLNMQYKFTELEDGELKNNIIHLMKDSKKKVRHIKVYNESKKSTGKNAFLLKILFYREFGIADNFLDGNSDDELLAVLSHEIGHLKHKKNIYNYIKYIFGILMVVLLIVGLPHLDYLLPFYNDILKAFNISSVNLILLGDIAGTFLTPLGALISVYMNYVSRREEYEADDNAVKNGYGEALIRTFKKLSSDELIDVNPSPIIEALEFDHPGMYTRITHIHEEIKRLAK